MMKHENPPHTQVIWMRRLRVLRRMLRKWRDAKKIDTVEADLNALDAALGANADLRALIHSPLYSRDAQGKAIDAIAAKMGLGEIVGNTLRLMASKRRLFVLPQLITSLRGLIAEEKGEVTAEVRSAKELTPAQRDALAAKLKAK